MIDKILRDNISRRDTLRRLFASAATGMFLPPFISCQKGGLKKPNIVLILADDLGYGDLSCYGCPDIRSYNIDQIAKEGIKFTQFYVSCPVCSPSRASLLTGRYQQRTGLVDNMSRSADRRLKKKKKLLSEYLKEVGYKTGITGKWHLGFKNEYLPTRRGFDEFYGFLGGMIDYYTYNDPDDHDDPEGSDLFRGETPIKEKGYFTELITREAVDFIDRHKNEQFFLYVPYNAPHTRLQPPGEPLDGRQVSYDMGEKAKRERYIKMVECMDEGIGQILERLRKYGLDENTLVLFLSDNGAQPGRASAGRNYPLRGAKADLFEGGIRIPCVMKWHNHIPEGKVIEIPAISMDLFTTILSAAGIPKPEDSVIDGNDLMPVIEGKVKKNHEFLCWDWQSYRDPSPNLAIRKDNWKYHKTTRGEEFLFDLSTDLREENNLIDVNSEIAEELKILLNKWEKEVKGEM